MNKRDRIAMIAIAAMLIVGLAIIGLHFFGPQPPIVKSVDPNFIVISASYVPAVSSKPGPIGRILHNIRDWIKGRIGIGVPPPPTPPPATRMIRTLRIISGLPSPPLRGDTLELYSKWKSPDMAETPLELWTVDGRAPLRKFRALWPPQNRDTLVAGAMALAWQVTPDLTSRYFIKTTNGLIVAEVNLPVRSKK